MDVVRNMKHKLVEVELKNQILTICLNNEKKLNAISEAMVDELYECVQYINQSDEIKVCLITGSPKAFSAGVDISEIEKLTDDKAFLFLNEKWEAAANIRVPVIACVSGYALGGGFELALMCDMIVASEKAVFGFSEVNLGLLPGNGGTQRLPRLVGTNRAFEMISTGKVISAQDALNMGVVNRIVTDDLLCKEGLSLAEELSCKPFYSLIAIKSAIKASKSVPLSEGLTYERNLFRSLLTTHDKQRLVHKFLKK